MRVTGVEHSSVSVCLCVCLSVCLSVRTIEPNLLKPNLPSIMSPGYSFNIRSEGQLSRSQKEKHISCDQVDGVSLHFIKWPSTIVK